VASLMVGNAPEVSARGALFALLLTALPLGLLLLLGIQADVLGVSLLIAAAASVTLAILAWKLAASALTGVE
jgi:hypothetical protein